MPKRRKKTQDVLDTRIQLMLLRNDQKEPDTFEIGDQSVIKSFARRKAPTEFLSVCKGITIK